MSFLLKGLKNDCTFLLSSWNHSSPQLTIQTQFLIFYYLAYNLLLTLCYFVSVAGFPIISFIQVWILCTSWDKSKRSISDWNNRLIRNSYFYIKKWTFKGMCEVYYRESEIIKKQHAFKSVHFECRMVFFTWYWRKVDFSGLFFHRM